MRGVSIIFGMTTAAAKPYWRRRFSTNLCLRCMHGAIYHGRMPNPGFRTVANSSTQHCSVRVLNFSLARPFSLDAVAWLTCASVL